MYRKSRGSGWGGAVEISPSCQGSGLTLREVLQTRLQFGECGRHSGMEAAWEQWAVLLGVG